jgi:hypothetical protein
MSMIIFLQVGAIKSGERSKDNQNEIGKRYKEVLCLNNYHRSSMRTWAFIGRLSSGTQGYWEHMGFTGDDLQLTLLNTEPIEVTLPQVTSVIGDARDMREFKDKEFEIVFSNAVIEHVGNFDQQRHMAEEVQRVGKRYILHTPNRYFPIEPHVLIPFFQFLPLSVKVFLATHSPNWGWKASHLGELSTIRLMSERELRSIFPGARVYKERFWGLTKSFILYKGW